MTENSGSEQTSVPQKWNLLQFAVISCYTVGCHGITSLPYYIYKHSGLFLVAYYVLVVLICVPVCYVQIKLGAIYKRHLVGMFSVLIPILKGVAVSLLLLTYIRCLLHGVELSYCLYYSFASLQHPFIWGGDVTNSSASLNFYHRPADKFFHEEFLQKSDHIGEGGTLLWYSTLCMLTTWTIVYFMTVKGTSMLGKIAYGLTPTALLFLLIVLVYGFVNIPHSSRSISRLLGIDAVDTIKRGDPESHSEKIAVVQNKLGSPRPWIDAMHLHLNSIGLWAGVLPTLGSQISNKKYVINIAWISLLLVYSVLPEVAMFALAPYIDPHDSGGFIAASKGIKPGLPYLFVAIPTTFEKLELSPFIGFCLFMCVFLFGIFHQALHVLIIWENLLPSTPKFIMTYFRRRECLVAAACFFSFLLTLPYAAQGGIHLYAVINDYVDRLIFTLIIISTVPFLTGYIKQDFLYLPIERLCISLWYGFASLISAGLLIYYFAVFVYPSPVVGYEQRWAEDLGWCVAASPVVCGLLLGAVHAIGVQKGSVSERFVQSLKSDTLTTTDTSNDVTSGETGDTGLHTTVKSQSADVMTVDKTETEVFIPQLDAGSLSKV